MKTPNRISSRRCLTNANLLRFLAFLVVCLCLTVGTVLGAGEQAKKEAKKEVKEKSKSASEEKVLITGSLIPQKVKRGRIPATASPVVIIDQKDIERSGATTVAQALRKQGLGR